MCNPTISIIIPAYNAQEYLRECLDSVLVQTFSNYEAIVINDGSTDSTLEIAESYSRLDNRIRVVSTENQGVSCARNIGINLSHGHWITFLDSDDTLLQKSLELLHNAAIASSCRIVKGSWTRKIPMYTDATRSPISIYPAYVLTEVTLYQTFNDSSPCAALYDRDILTTVKFKAGIRYEDLDFFYRAYLQTDKVAVIPDIIYYYRDNPRSFINDFTPARLDVLSVTAQLERYMADKYPDLLPAARDRRLSANFNMFALLMLKTPSSDFLTEKQGCWNVIRSYRKECLLNHKTRLKNKFGSLLSFLGQRAFVQGAKLIYR